MRIRTYRDYAEHSNVKCTNTNEIHATWHSHTNRSYVILTHVYTVHWMNDEPERWQKVGTISSCLLFVGRCQRITQRCAEAGQQQTCDCSCDCLCESETVFLYFEHLKQVWLETFTTKQKGAHCQTFWSSVHNASISRLVSAQLFVCSVRNSIDDDDHFYKRRSKRIKKTTAAKKVSTKTKL